MSIVATILWKNVILATPKDALNNVMLIKITQASQMISGKIVTVKADRCNFRSFLRPLNCH